MRPRGEGDREMSGQPLPGFASGDRYPLDAAWPFVGALDLPAGSFGLDFLLRRLADSGALGLRERARERFESEFGVSCASSVTSPSRCRRAAERVVGPE